MVTIVSRLFACRAYTAAVDTNQLL
jgi:hypothetical protein